MLDYGGRTEMAVKPYFLDFFDDFSAIGGGLRYEL